MRAGDWDCATFKPWGKAMIAHITLVSMAVIFALATFSLTFPKCFTYATSVSGWLDMYMHRKVDLSATGSFASVILKPLNQDLER